MGILTWATGIKYNGYFLNDMKHGKGKETYTNTDYYDGEWLYNLAHGEA